MCREENFGVDHCSEVASQPTLKSVKSGAGVAHTNLLLNVRKINEFRTPFEVRSVAAVMGHVWVLNSVSPDTHSICMNCSLYRPCVS